MDRPKAINLQTKAMDRPKVHRPKVIHHPKAIHRRKAIHRPKAMHRRTKAIHPRPRIFTRHRGLGLRRRGPFTMVIGF